MLFLAWLFSITIEPVVDWLERRGLRRGAATGLVLFAMFVFAVGFLALFGTLLAQQLAQLLKALPGALSSVTDWSNRVFDTDFATGEDLIHLTPETIRDLAERFTPGVLGVLSSLLGVVFQMLTLLLFVFYMSAQGPALRRTISSWFPARQQRAISVVWEISVEKAGGYVVSRLILAAVSSVATGIFLVVIGVPYWLPLALWTGIVSQFVPHPGHLPGDRPPRNHRGGLPADGRCVGDRVRDRLPADRELRAAPAHHVRDGLDPPPRSRSDR